MGGDKAGGGMTHCPYCEWNIAETDWSCRSRCPGEYPYFCSREDGHEGAHVACGTDRHQVATWKGGKRLHG